MKGEIEMFNQSIWGKLKEFFTECLEALLDEFVAIIIFGVLIMIAGAITLCFR